MSSSETARRRARPLPRRAAMIVLSGIALVGIAGCTAGPLYGTTSVDPTTGARAGVLTALRGRIAVSQAQTRTAQVFRNAILYKLNGAEPVAQPLYELRFAVSATDQIAALETGTGVPAASLYRMTVDYQLVRLADGKELVRGQRFAMAPYDRSEQLYASQRAVIDARDQAGTAVSERVLAAVAPVLQREGFAGPASLAAAPLAAPAAAKG